MKELIMYSSTRNTLMQVLCTFTVNVEEWVSSRLCLLTLNLLHEGVRRLKFTVYNINIPPRL